MAKTADRKLATDNTQGSGGDATTGDQPIEVKPADASCSTVDTGSPDTKDIDAVISVQPQWACSPGGPHDIFHLGSLSVS